MATKREVLACLEQSQLARNFSQPTNARSVPGLAPALHAYQAAALEWMLQRDDQWEIKKTYAMAAFVSLRRREAVSVEEAIKRAAGTFVANANAKKRPKNHLRLHQTPSRNQRWSQPIF